MRAAQIGPPVQFLMLPFDNILEFRYLYFEV
jgi:hypothetical protein